MKTIFVPIDFSDETQVLFAHARKLATSFNSEIVIVHVSIKDRVYSLMDKPDEIVNERDQLAHQLRNEHKMLQKYAEEFIATGIKAKGILLQGIPEEMIIEEANDHNADLIIMGSHGQGKLFEMLVGSTCTGVLKNTDIPVLVIPSKKGETK